MPDATNQVCDAEEFDVELIGVPVSCVSLEDAVAVKTANDILTNSDPTPYKMDVILPIVRVLGQYGRHTEAKKLSAMFR